MAMRASPFLLLLWLSPLLLGAQCDGPRETATPIDAMEAYIPPTLAKPPVAWVLVEKRRHPSQRPQPIIFSARHFQRVFLSLDSGREVVLMMPLQAEISPQMVNLAGYALHTQLAPHSRLAVGPFRGRIEKDPGRQYYDRVFEGDGHRRWLLLVDVDQRPKEGPELEGMVRGTADDAHTRSQDVEFVPLAYLLGEFADSAGHARSQEVEAQSEPKQTTRCGDLPAPWRSEGGDTYVVEPAAQFEVESTHLTPETVATLRQALTALPTRATLSDVYIDVHPSVADHYATRSRNLPKQRAAALQDFIGRPASVRLVDSEPIRGRPTVRFAVRCARPSPNATQ